MSVSYWWLGFFITRDDHARLLPRFEAARLEAAPTHVAHQPAVEIWKADPEALEDGVRKDNYAVNDFQAAFFLRGYDALSQALLSRDGDFADIARQETLFRFASIRRSPPVAVLWHALGFERANVLPGDKGNLLVHPDDVARLSDDVNFAYRGLDLSGAVARGHRFCSGSGFSVEDVKEVVTFLPDGLRRAAELGKGLVAVAHQAP